MDFMTLLKFVGYYLAAVFGLYIAVYICTKAALHAWWNFNLEKYKLSNPEERRSQDG